MSFIEFLDCVIGRIGHCLVGLWHAKLVLCYELNVMLWSMDDGYGRVAIPIVIR